MPKKARELSAVEVRRLNRPGYHAVGGVSGLLLQVTQSGAKSWILRFRLAGRRRALGVGAFPDVTLAQARDRAREFRDQIAQGIDPIDARRETRATVLAQRVKTLTFDEATPKFLSTKAKEFRNRNMRKIGPAA